MNTKIIFSKSDSSSEGNRIEFAVFCDGELTISSGRAQYPIFSKELKIPENWAFIRDCIIDKVKRKTVLSDSKFTYYGEDIAYKSDTIIKYRFYHPEKKEEVEYHLPKIREDDKNKNKITFMKNDLNGEIISVLITLKEEAIFFGRAGTFYSTVNRAVKPLYEFERGKCKLSEGFELEENEFLIGRTKKDSETEFRILRPVL